MSVFGKQGYRCDGCGIFTNNKRGEYELRDGRNGVIANYGRNCNHDYCSDCESKLDPPEQCGVCGMRTATMENEEWNRAIEQDNGNNNRP